MGYLVEPGEIRSTWVDLWGLTIPENSHVFTMVFVAKKPGKLSESLTTYPQGMSLHAWTVPIVEVPLQWVFLEIIKTGPMQCYVSQKVIERAQESVPLPAQKIDFAAYPNPTTGNVTLTLPTAGRVTVFDALGRMESETEGIEGANGITLTGATGLKLIKFQGTVKTIIKQ